MWQRVNLLDKILKTDITKLYIGELESAFLVVKNRNSGCDVDVVDIDDDEDNDDDLQKANSNSSQLTRVPSTRIKNIATSRSLTKKLKTSSDGCKGKLSESTSKKNSDSSAISVSSSGKKKNISSALDCKDFANTEINRMNKPA